MVSSIQSNHCLAGDVYPTDQCLVGGGGGGGGRIFHWLLEWSGVEWSGVEWSGVEWSGVEWRVEDMGCGEIHLLDIIQ